MNSKNLSKTFTLLSGLLWLGVSGCSKKPQAEPVTYSSALIVVPDAKGAQYAKTQWGTDQVTYVVAEKYPAVETLKAISSRLESEGWIPLKEDALNPGTPSSQVRGWTVFGDETGKGAEEVRQWLTDWKNHDGDVIRYELKYSYPTALPPDLGTLQVTAIYLPAVVYKSLEETRKRNMPNH